MAAGVGKTYRMLQEGRAELEGGRDVVIGYLEPHDRAETDRAGRRARAGRPPPPDLQGRAVRGDGSSRAPRAAARAGPHRRARPHQRARRRARASATRTSPTCSPRGIDVYSTVNVQHLESLKDQVAELTGVTVRETFPDTVLSKADEVVLVDLTPATLIERLQAGKVYPAARVPAALNGFFRVENLEALREVALRQVAEDVEAKRLKDNGIVLREDRLRDRAAPMAVAERLLALVTPQPVVAADRAPGLALGAAPGRGPRRPHRACARALAGGARADRGVPPPRLAARRGGPGRGGRRPPGGRRARGAGARIDVRADRDAGAAARAQAARRAARRPPRPRAAGDRRAHRRRPLEAGLLDEPRGRAHPRA